VIEISGDQYLCLRLKRTGQPQNARPSSSAEANTSIQKTKPALMIPPESPAKSASIPMLPTAWIPSLISSAQFAPFMVFCACFHRGMLLQSF